MRHLTRWIGATLFALASGCAATHFPGQPTSGDLSRDLSLDETSRSSRAQRGDEPIVVAQAPRSASDLAPPPPGLGTPPAPQTINDRPPPLAGLGSLAPKTNPPPSLLNSPNPLTNRGASDLAPPPTSGTQQTSLSTSSTRAARVMVRAWVNGRPIFDDEVDLQVKMGGMMRGGEAYNEAYNKALNNIIEFEIAYQDAVKKLEKFAPKMLEKLKDEVDAEYDRQARHIRRQIPDEAFVEIAAPLRRLQERQFIAMQYIRSRIDSNMHVNFVDIEDYYKTHLNEFQTLPTVKWQHIFVATNATDRRTAEDAATLGAKLIDEVSRDAKPSQRFAQLCKQYDDGDSKSRDGLGFGIRKGEIRPAELETELFKMEPGQIGILKVTTGAHVYRLESRVVGGQTPLNETVQAQIRNKIRNQVFERELKRVVRDLKSRAVVEVEKGI